MCMCQSLRGSVRYSVSRHSTSIKFSDGITLQTTLTFWHWASVSPHMLSYDFAETCVFGKQSPTPILATRRYPFSQSYEVILPSSLERVISRPLVFSTYLPVSVWYRYLLLNTNLFLEDCSSSIRKF